MRKLIILISLFGKQLTIPAQDNTVKHLKDAGTKVAVSLDSNGWRNSGTFIINLNQGAISNWVAGGEKSVLGINGVLSQSIKYKRNKTIWDNNIDLALGFQHAASFGKFRKSDDRVDITSKAVRQLYGKIYSGLLFNLNTQFLPGFDYAAEPALKISNWLTPGKVILAPGFDYRPGDQFSLFFSPVTVRWVFKTDKDFLRVAKFGVDSASKVSREFGAGITAKFAGNLSERVYYSGRADLFSNYLHKPQNMDILVTNLLVLKITKHISSNLSFDILYDDDLIKRIQVKEMIGIGLLFNL